MAVVVASKMLDKLSAPLYALLVDKLNVPGKVATGAAVVVSVLVARKLGCLVGDAGHYVYTWISSSRKRSKKRKQWQIEMQKWSEEVAAIKLPKDRVDEILSYTLEQLIEKLQKGEVTSAEALQAYQIAALEAHRKTNCITQPIFEAKEWAAACDRVSDKSKPLHGVPMSIKENYLTQGYDTTLGCASLVGQKPGKDEEAVLFQVLREQGAIPFVKTNVPQTMMSTDCKNPIYGATTNPFDSSRTPGGSSGGEGAILGAKGAILGLGNDIGGSIRVPAHSCGVYGFKPTTHRLSSKGCRVATTGQQIVRGSMGPMARDVDSLVIEMRALLVSSMFERDRLVPPIPFREDMYSEKRPLRIGYYEDDGYFPAMPACRRAVQLSKAALEKQGHELVEINLSVLYRRAVSLYLHTVFADGGKNVLKRIYGDKWDQSMHGFIALAILNPYFKKIVIWLVSKSMPNFALGWRSSFARESVAEYYDLATDVEKLKNEMNDAWLRLGIDAVLAPGAAAPAMLLGVPGKSVSALSYQVVHNVLNYPAGSLPVTTVTDEDEQDVKNIKVADPMEYWVKKSSMQGTVGLSVNVQLITPPWTGERCLRLMKELETALKA